MATPKKRPTRPSAKPKDLWLDVENARLDAGELRVLLKGDRGDDPTWIRIALDDHQEPEREYKKILDALDHNRVVTALIKVPQCEALRFQALERHGR